ncbi:Transcriptional regulatory protein DegU [Streptomyces sp. Go-475]|nr:Transcriptional regulatory protein DegU [Streptomyces sp. Go-475]
MDGRQQGLFGEFRAGEFADDPSPGDDQAMPYGLSPRELEVLTRAATGQTNQAIAQALFLSPRTVHSHVEHLLRKTGCVSRAQATALAVRDGLLRPDPDHLARFVEA